MAWHSALAAMLLTLLSTESADSRASPAAFCANVPLRAAERFGCAGFAPAAVCHALRARPPVTLALRMNSEGTKQTSFSEQVHLASTAYDILDASQSLDLRAPGDGLLSSSASHQRKVWRNSCAALCKLSSLLLGGEKAAERDATLRDHGIDFARLCAAASAAPRVEGNDQASRGDANAALGCVRALAILAPHEAAAHSTAVRLAAVMAPFVDSWPPHMISSAHWSLTRLGLIRERGEDDVMAVERAYLKLQLPFKVSHSLLADIPAAEGAEGEVVTLDTLRAEIPFRKGQLVTRSGQRVDERRETCWMADPGLCVFTCLCCSQPVCLSDYHIRMRGYVRGGARFPT